ncbi:hypothetical protein HKBW3S43_00645 [Candidatus Hakubella thermalkaliphila]|uniref:HepT-like domain-containing protein n=1 Tax=Candidatus Hakubella thermalkaliphila TaxID=2754717 RepID=A0A6V8PRN6_9ACTN|nr:hypothetical protein [Candidatus Hakubella thermalkaliphila]GFP34853.1 hypothetical protein HKBW3S43_00645 [Candidatus Hakubella thermalkaliphila]
MEKESLAILRAETQVQIGEIERIYAKLEERKRKRGKTGIESVAYQLHNLYCAFKDLFKIIANTFENHIQDKSQYHLELLKRMTMPIEGVRPSLLSQKSYVLLDNLRSFRHFFRHAYSYELDERKVKIVLEDAITLRELYRQDIKTFLDSFI